MTSKVTNLIKDREFKFRIIILAIIFTFMGWQFYTVYSQKKEIIVLKKEKERKRALMLAQRNNKSNRGTDSLGNYRLEGITNNNGTFQALINGAVYNVGDSIDQYKITEITLRSSTLQDLSTLEIRRLEFDQ